MGDSKKKPKQDDLTREIERLKKKAKKSFTYEDFIALAELERQAQLLNR